MDSAVVDPLGVEFAGRTMPDEYHPGRICGVRDFDQSSGVNSKTRDANRAGGLKFLSASGHETE